MTAKAVTAYGIWDTETGDLVLLPGPDGYCRSLFNDIGILKFCLGSTQASIVKITVEPATETIEQMPAESNIP